MKYETRKDKCKEKTDVCGNWECLINRRRYSGLGQCLCKKENCPKENRTAQKEG
jgi:hypothetical protein